MLSFELKRTASGALTDEIEVYLDSEGLDSLLVQLRFLKEGRTEHVHLMSEAWVGTHLEDQPQDSTNSSLHHVKILLLENKGV